MHVCRNGGREHALTVSDKAMRPGRVATLYRSAQSWPFHTFQPSVTSAGFCASESVYLRPTPVSLTNIIGQQYISQNQGMARTQSTTAYRQHCSPSISGPRLQLCPSCHRKFFAAPGCSLWANTVRPFSSGVAAYLQRQPQQPGILLCVACLFHLQGSSAKRWLNGISSSPDGIHSIAPTNH